MRSLTPTVRERLEELRREAIETPELQRDSLKSDLELQEPAVDAELLELQNPASPEAVDEPRR